MKEFLVADEFLAEAAAFSSAGKSLNEGNVGIDGGGVSTLAAGMAYIDQQKVIEALMESYIALIEKDARELIELQAAAAELDKRLADSLAIN